MFNAFEDRQRTIRATEYAAVARWFSPSPMGLLFHGDDGTARPIAPDAAAAGQRKGEAVVDAFLAEMQSYVVLGIGIVVAAVIIAWCIADLFDLTKPGVTGAGIGVGFLAVHLIDIVRLAAMRRTQKAVRAGIAESLRTAAPVPAAAAQRYRRRNPWQTALGVLIGGFLLLAMVSMHDERMFTFVPAIIWLLIVPVAWGLFGMAKYTDAQQARRERHQR